MPMTVVGHPLFRLLAIDDIKFLLGFLTFCIVILVLAYLTNPSESSFRAYLTEQSFRLHLSRLDHLDDPQDDLNPLAHALTSSITSNSSSPCAFTLDNPALVHFATRASVSLRTPKHVFHSFGIFTVATMLPIAKAPRNDSHMSSVVNDSWHVGAFGKWWRGGGIEAWYRDVIARSKDEENTSSGILSMTNLDLRHDYPGLPTLSSTHRGVPPKSRNRERSSQTNGLPARSETPPPLPKSVSLPLHASCSKHSSCISWPNINTSTLSTLTIPNPSGQSNQGTSAEALPNFSPRVTDLLRQIAQTQRTVVDLRVQVSECKSATSQSRLHLQGKLDTQRECRRREDAIKVDLKFRTKSLDDSKRQAEGLKRDAEKKLRAAQTATTNAADFLSALGKKIAHLHAQMANDQSFISHQPATQSASLASLTEELDRKRQQIKVTEVHISSLSQHARELESKLSEARERLKHLKHKIGNRKSEMQQLTDDPVMRSLSSSFAQSMDGHDPTAILLERPFQLEAPAHHINRLEPSPATSEITESTCSPTSLHHYETTLPIDLSRHICLGDHSATFLSRGSVSASPDSIFLLGRGGSVTSPYSTSLEAYQDRGETKLKLNGDQGMEAKVQINTVVGNAWGHLPEFEHVGAELLSGNARQHDWHHFGLQESGSKFDTSPKPRRSTAAGQLDPSTLYDVLNPLRYHASSAVPVATTSNPSFLQAFAPSPAERQVFQRTLGSASNSSLERMPSLGDVGRVPISPPLLTGASKDVTLGSRALPSWMLSPQNHHVNFSPWDDEEQEQSS